MSAAARTVAIIQARLGSSRLPGKMLLPLGDASVVAQTIRRCRRIPGLHAVICATSALPTDDALAAAAEAEGALVHRGDERDVLARYRDAARAFDAEVILRVTGDCPLIDPAICAAVLELRRATGADYAANNMPRSFPHGLDCEAFTRASLELAAAEATAAYDREHVTPWLRRAPAIRRANLAGPGWPAARQRWTLDYPEDHRFLRGVYDLLPPAAGMQEILSLLGAHPGLSQANAALRAPAADGAAATYPIIAFRIAAGARIGLGHAMRCAALMSVLEPLGWRCFWLLAPAAAAFLAPHLAPQSIVLLPDEAPVAQAEHLLSALPRCDWLVIDDYETPPTFAAALYGRLRVMQFDDLAEQAIAADLILNPTPGFEASRYAPLNVEGAALLLGPRYALLRRQFVARRPAALARREKTPTVRRLLIAFGGVDPLGGTMLALEAAATVADPSCRIDIVLGAAAAFLPAVRRQAVALGARARLHVDLADMAGLMAESDLVIAAPGTASFERCCLGLPALLVGIAENQRANAAFLAASGAAVPCGFLTTDPPEAVAGRLAAALRGLLSAPERLREMARAAAQFCDGRGTQRVALSLLAPASLKDGAKLVLRLAEKEDEALLLDWQRAPATRRFALDARIPSPEEHRAWFSAKLAAAEDWLMIGEAESVPCGFLRLDWFGEDDGRPQYLASIAAAPGHYRRGIGSRLLAQARALMPAAHFYARILPGNAASMALFTAAGYKEEADGYFHARPPAARME